MPETALRTAVALLFALSAALWPGPGPGAGRGAFGLSPDGALAALQPGARPVAAGDEWCENDPLVIVVTPRGNRLPVHVTNYGLGVQYLPLVEQASIKYSVGSAPYNLPGTLVTFDVLVPSAKVRGKTIEFPTRSVISSLEFGKGFVYARAEGRAGNVMKMEFYTPLP